MPQPKTFQLKGIYSNVLPEELSERWKIGIEQARETIAKTTQILTRSAVMLLLSLYKSDRVFQTKKITGMGATYTMDVQVKSLDYNQYVQVISNGTYFA